MKRTLFTLLWAVVAASPARAGVVEIFEATNSSKKPAIDSRITLNAAPTAAASDVLGPGTVVGNQITFAGGPLAGGASQSIAISSANGVMATKVEYSFAANGGAEVEDPLALVNYSSGKFTSGGVLHGFVDVTNLDANMVSFSNFQAAVNISESNFGSSQAQLQGAIANNLYLGSGTPVVVPSSFQLGSGESLFFDLGVVSASGYEAATFHYNFTDTMLPPSAIDFGGVASDNVVPEPPSFVLCGVAGVVGLACACGRWRATSQAGCPASRRARATNVMA